MPRYHQRLASEMLGAAFLLATVVGSGIMAELLAGGNGALALLANSLATGAGLIALILVFEPISSHFNPVVTLWFAINREMPWWEVPGYIAAQTIGALIGVAAAHAMFGLAVFSASSKMRSGMAQTFAEFIATLGLLLVVASISKHRRNAMPYAVGAYITAAYWFTASTSFANPAVTLARATTATFTGIRLEDTGSFILSQTAALLIAVLICRWLFR